MQRIVYYSFVGWEPTEAERDVISQAMAFAEEHEDGAIFFAQRAADDPAGADLGIFMEDNPDGDGEWGDYYADAGDLVLYPIWRKRRVFQAARQENLIRHEIMAHVLGYGHSRNPLSCRHPASTNIPWRAGF